MTPSFSPIFPPTLYIKVSDYPFKRIRIYAYILFSDFPNLYIYRKIGKYTKHYPSSRFSLFPLLWGGGGCFPSLYIILCISLRINTVWR
jgi:hypothetical protein